jgi:hypothetical protein
MFGVDGALRPWPGAAPPAWRVALDEAEHLYTVRNWTASFFGIPWDAPPTSRHIVSGTGLNKKYFEEFDPDECLDKWYDKWQLPGGNVKYRGKSREQIKEEWTQNGRNASGLGTAMHLNNELFYTEDKLPDNVQTEEWVQFLKFVKEVLPKEKMLVPEMKLFAPEYRLCGCADIIAVGDTPGGVKLLDYKRSKHTCRPNEHVFGRRFGYGPCREVKANSHGKYTVQLNLYRVLLQRYYGVTVESMHLVRMYPGLPTYDLIEVPIIEDVIVQMLEERRRELRLMRLFRAAGAAVVACWRLRRGVWRVDSATQASVQSRAQGTQTCPDALFELAALEAVRSAARAADREGREEDGVV